MNKIARVKIYPVNYESVGKGKVEVVTEDGEVFDLPIHSGTWSFFSDGIARATIAIRGGCIKMEPDDHGPECIIIEPEYPVSDGGAI